MAQNIFESMTVGDLVAKDLATMAGNNMAWEADSLRIFGSTNEQAWPFSSVPISTDGIGKIFTAPFIGKRKGRPYSSSSEASLKHLHWTVAQATVGRGAAMDIRFLDPILGSTFCDLKGVSKAPHFGGDRKIRLAGGSLKYCQAKLNICQGNDNADYLLWIVWHQANIGLCEYRLNMTKVVEAYKGNHKIVYTRPHKRTDRDKEGKVKAEYSHFDLDFKYASLEKFICKRSPSAFERKEARIQHHIKIATFLYETGCTDTILPVQGQADFDGDWSPWKMNPQKTWWF